LFLPEEIDTVFFPSFDLFYFHLMRRKRGKGIQLVKQIRFNLDTSQQQKPWKWVSDCDATDIFLKTPGWCIDVGIM